MDKQKNPVKLDIVLTDEQKTVKSAILDGNKPYIFLTGVAGTSKTFLACAVALDLLFKKQIDKIVITRPTVSTEDNGFLPGTLEEKLEPWMVPIRENMRTIYNKPDKLQQLERDKIIEIVPLTFFRGRTMSTAVCIIDEAQNLSVEQLKMALTRLGKNSIMIFCGDTDQIDLKKKTDSALTILTKLEDSEDVSIFTLKENHRHPAIIRVLKLINGES